MSNKNIAVNRILVIDDNASIHEDFRKILIKPRALDDHFLDMESTLFGDPVRPVTSVNFELDSAFQGKEGLDRVQKARAEGRPYALAFVDVRMPPGWDGIETISRIWKVCPDLQVVLCTAYADYSWPEICRILGETDNLLILKKPFDNVEVLQMAHALTRKWELNRNIRDQIENLDDMVRKRTAEKEHIGAMLETALEHSPAGIIISETKNTGIDWANPSASRILGDTRLFDPKTRKPDHDHEIDWQVFRPDGRLYPQKDLPLSRAMMKGETVQNEELIIRDANGREKWISSNAGPVCNKDGIISAGILIFEDITELKRTQAEKLEAISAAAETEKLALVGQIAGKMAHDFNNVLGAIMGNSELALLDCPDQQMKKTLELIFEQTLRGRNLTKNLVAFARDQEPRREFFRMDMKIELVLDLLKRDLEDIHVVRRYAPDIPELLADPGMIEHSVVNLVQNAIHAVSLTPHPEIIIRTGYKDGRMILEIEDNGCGIPDESLKDLFTPAFTLKGSKDTKGLYRSGIKGTGYGMANVKKYITQHQGDITVHSRLHKGTKTIITLPVIHKGLTEQELTAVKENNISPEKHVLIVEDEPTISEVQKAILSNEPCRHTVDIAENGPVALHFLKKNQYDAISLDYVLPGKINGMDIYRHIRKTNRTVPILFVSGNIEFLESIKDLKKNDPFIDHLSKPCKNTDYIYRINKLLMNA